jgi:hypothetical protein
MLRQEDEGGDKYVYLAEAGKNPLVVVVVIGAWWWARWGG